MYKNKEIRKEKGFFFKVKRSGESEFNTMIIDANFSSRDWRLLSRRKKEDSLVLVKLG